MMPGEAKTPVADVKQPFQCYGCHGFGHMARNSPNKAKPGVQAAEQVRLVKNTDPRSMLDHPVYLKAYVGRKQLTFLVDTGCDRSIMPSRMVERARLDPAECRLYAANGTTISVLGEVMLDLRVGNEIMPTRFILSNSILEPMLGSDWLRCNKIMRDFSCDVLSWSSKSVKLMTGEEIKNCARIKKIRVQQ